MYQGLSLSQAPPEDIPNRFFLSAPMFGFFAGLLILLKGNQLFSNNWAIETIALTHLFTLGFLTMVMIGAFYQMVPVLVGGSVPYIYLSKAVHIGLLLGVTLLVIGLYFLKSAALFAAVILLFLSLGFFVIQIAVAVFNVKSTGRPTIVAMRISIISLAITLILGIIFVGGLVSWWALSWNRIDLTIIHLLFGLFGWITILIMGVGFYVIPMFYLTPPFPLKKAKLILILQVLSLLLIPICLIAKLSKLWILVSGTFGIVGIFIFIISIFQLLHNRKRKLVDTTIRLWQTGLVSLFLAILSVVVYQLVGDLFFVFSFAIFFFIGFAVSIISGQLYKIVPFLVWFHRFSHLIGKKEVPLLKDIMSDKISKMQWKTLLAAIVVLIIGAATQFDLIIRLGGVIFMISTGFLFVNILKAVRIKAPQSSEQDAKI